MGAPALAGAREHRFRKRPVEVEAWQIGSRSPAPEWLTEGLQTGEIKPADGRVDCFLISTLEGVMFASPRDWIIRGVLGELYPCKPEAFQLTYEAIE